MTRPEHEFAIAVLNDALAERPDVSAADVRSLLPGDNAIDRSMQVAARLVAGWSIADITHEMRVLARDTG
jgi:hypothetical protein